MPSYDFEVSQKDDVIYSARNVALASESDAWPVLSALADAHADRPCTRLRVRNCDGETVILTGIVALKKMNRSVVFVSGQPAAAS